MADSKNPAAEKAAKTLTYCQDHGDKVLCVVKENPDGTVDLAYKPDGPPVVTSCPVAKERAVGSAWPAPKSAE
jgi:hypothetical protein